MQQSLTYFFIGSDLYSSIGWGAEGGRKVKRKGNKISNKRLSEHTTTESDETNDSAHNTQRIFYSTLQPLGL